MSSEATNSNKISKQNKTIRLFERQEKILQRALGAMANKLSISATDSALVRYCLDYTMNNDPLFEELSKAS